MMMIMMLIALTSNRQNIHKLHCFTTGRSSICNYYYIDIVQWEKKIKYKAIKRKTCELYLSTPAHSRSFSFTLSLSISRSFSSLGSNLAPLKMCLRVKYAPHYYAKVFICLHDAVQVYIICVGIMYTFQFHCREHIVS